jgi:hypothetical protein
MSVDTNTTQFVSDENFLNLVSASLMDIPHVKCLRAQPNIGEQHVALKLRVERTWTRSYFIN